MARVSSADLRRLRDHPEVAAAITANEQALLALREARRTVADAERLADQTADHLHEVAARLLAEQGKEG